MISSGCYVSRAHIATGRVISGCWNSALERYGSGGRYGDILRSNRVEAFLYLRELERSRPAVALGVREDE